MFYLETGRKEDCCGCRACEHICPMNCIKMMEDEEGFYYPLKNDDLCSHCNLCEKVCPNVNKNKLSSFGDKVFQPKAYMAVHKDETVLAESASGGVFSAIVQSYCKDNFAVFGVEFEENFHAIHSCAETIEGTKKYRKSKYIQSDIKDSYKKAENFLKEDRRVLFTGTPCQIAGLRLYLRKDYNNLFCVDLVCHGVPSQKVFNAYKDYLKKKYEGDICSFTFRHKTHIKNQGWNSRNIKAVINDKTIVLNSLEDVYLRGYHSGLFYRLSCYECKFANPNRVSDITMADFWGVEKLYPDVNVHKGVSVLLANTVKGQLLVQQINKQMKLDEVDINYVIESNAQLNHSAKLHPKREQFYRLLKTKRFDEAVDSCIPRPPLIIRITSKILPQGIKDAIVKILSKIGVVY